MSMEQPALEENQHPSTVISQDLEAQNGEAQDDLEARSSRPVHNTGWLKYIVDYVLGDHYPDPKWRLRLLSTFNCVFPTMFGAFFLPNYLHKNHGTYQRVVAITTVSAPVGFAAISLFLSFGLSSERTGWFTGLLVGNICLIGGAIGVYSAIQNGTGR